MGSEEGSVGIGALAARSCRVLNFGSSVFDGYLPSLMQPPALRPCLATPSKFCRDAQCKKLHYGIAGSFPFLYVIWSMIWSMIGGLYSKKNWTK